MPYPVTHGVTTFLPPPKDYVVDFDNPQKRDALEHFLIFGFLGSLAILCLAQRLYTKYFIVRGLKVDDVLLIFAWACSVIMQGVQMWSISIGGLCHHAWEMPIDVFEKHMLSSYIAGPVFIICNGLSKTSLLTFYLQISLQVWYRRVIFVTIGFVILYTLAIADLLLFGCKPIRTAWDLYRLATRKCVDNAIVYIVTAAVNIISDLILFFIPMPMLVHLKMPLGQRIGAGIMFGIASITVATSIIRMVYLPPLLGAVDIPWVAAPANVWSIVEANLFIICTSMTTFCKFFQHVAPNWMGSSIIYSSESVPDRFQTNKQKRKHTGHIQHDSVELANYPDAVKHDTLVTACRGMETTWGNMSEEAILQESKISCTVTIEVSHSQ